MFPSMLSHSIVLSTIVFWCRYRWFSLQVLPSDDCHVFFYMFLCAKIGVSNLYIINSHKTGCIHSPLSLLSSADSWGPITWSRPCLLLSILAFTCLCLAAWHCDWGYQSWHPVVGHRRHPYLYHSQIPQLVHLLGWIVALTCLDCNLAVII